MCLIVCLFFSIFQNINERIQVYQNFEDPKQQLGSEEMNKAIFNQRTTITFLDSDKKKVAKHKKPNNGYDNS